MFDAARAESLIARAATLDTAADELEQEAEVHLTCGGLDEHERLHHKARSYRLRAEMKRTHAIELLDRVIARC